jgi:hypothetical protein
MLIGGAFSTVGGVARSNVARILAGGTVDPAFDPVVVGEVRTLTTNPFSRTIHAGGQLTSVDGTARTRLAALDAAAVGVIVGGSFSQAGGVTRPCLARFSTAGSGTLDATWAPGSQGCTATDLLLDGGTASLYVAGTFSALGGLTRSNLAKVSTLGVGAGVAAFDAGLANNGRVLAIDRVSGGRLFVAGPFGTIGGQARRSLAALADDGDRVFGDGFD